MRKANCAKAMKTMPNMMKKAPTSGALRCSVPASCDMVLLKEMYLKILITPRNTFRQGTAVKFGGVWNGIQSCFDQFNHHLNICKD